MHTVTLEVRLLHLPTRASLHAAHGAMSDPFRALTVVRVDGDSGSGWGECAALNRVGYSPESAQTAYTLLSEHPDLGRVAAFEDLLNAAPMAMAALEMAEYDMRLKAAGIPLAEFLGIEATPIRAGAAVGLGSIDATLEAVGAAVGAGFGRVKLKVAPSACSGIRASEVVAKVTDAFSGLEVQVDGNGSFDRATASEIHELVGSGVSTIEQPFAATDTNLAAELVRAGTTVMADEAATDATTIEQLVTMSACTGVVVKPSRLGGLYRAMEVLQWCFENGVPASAGGMQESGLGRSSLAVVAGHPACTVTGDVGPARRWLAEDPWEDLEMIDGHIAIPAVAGVAGPPDVELLDRFTLKSTVRTLSIDDEGRE